MQSSEKNRGFEKESFIIDQNEGVLDEKPQKTNIFKRFFDFLKGKLSEKGEREVRQRLSRIVRFLLSVGVSYLICGVEFYFGTYPFAIALICSPRRYLPAAALGVGLAILSGTPPIYAYVCLAVIFARILITLLPLIFSENFSNWKTKSKAIIPHKKDAIEQQTGESTASGEGYIISVISDVFCEQKYVRVLCAAVAGAICGVLLLIESSFSVYDALATLVLTASSPLALMLLGGVYRDGENKRNLYTAVSMGALFFLAVYASKSLSVLGMPLAPCLATVITLYVCSGEGIVLGTAAALICGMAFDLTYLPLLVLSSVLFCLISAVKRNAGIAAVCGLALLWCYYIGGDHGLVKVLPPMLLAIPIYMLADKYREMMNAPFKRGTAAEEGLYFATAVTEQNKNAAVKERLSVLSDTFSSLSETFFKLSNRYRRSDALGIRKITDRAFESVCEGCRERERCWGSELSRTLEAVKSASSELYARGSVGVECLPEDFSELCRRKEKIIDEINGLTRRATEKMIDGGRANFFASNYDDITAILKDALSGDGEEYECDLALGEKVFEYLYSSGIGLKGVVVYGKRCRHVVAKGIEEIDSLSAEKSEEICVKVSEMLGIGLTLPIIEVSKDGNVMLMHSRPTVKASCAHGRVSGKGRRWAADEREDGYVDLFGDEELCGDMTEAFVTDNSYFYSLISDGMGSGASAAYTSGVCAMFIEKMLSAGNRADITLRMLNNVIRSENMGCGDECSATVDLLELDLMSGGAAFIKSGAAPTYIARAGTVYKISSRTMPVGIIKDADARITKFDTKKGDIIVMMSDGCCHDSDDCPWLVEYLCAYMTAAKKTVTVGEELCERLKEDILREALKNAPEGEERDDISVSVIVIG